MSQSFDLFRKAYDCGLQAIAVARTEQGSTERAQQDQIHRASISAYDGLATTTFGRMLTRETELQGVLNDFEAGQRAWFDLLTQDEASGDSSDLETWVMGHYCRDYRKFCYWGRVGSILHHFRSKGRSLNTFAEKHARHSINSKSSSLGDAISTLLLDPVVQTVYDEHVLKRLQQTLCMLSQIQEDLKIQPMERESVGSNPFQDGSTILRRQFVFAVSIMALELFGHITPAALDGLLEIKSSTADELGLIAWPFDMANQTLSADSRISMMRDNIRDVMKAGRARARKHQWVTQPLINYFDTRTKSRAAISKVLKKRGRLKNLSALPFWG